MPHRNSVNSIVSESGEQPQKRTKLSAPAPPKKPAPFEPSPADRKEEQERKRKEFLERNRVAASRFRKRKKEYIKKTEGDLQFYESEYEDLSQCMDKLCGISKQTVNSSLVGMLKQALLRHDVASSITVCNHIEQVLLQTKYVQRGGRNPRHEEEEKRRLESPDPDVNSDSNYPRRSSMATVSTEPQNGAPVHPPHQHLQHIKSDSGSQHPPPPDHATGTISNLPLVINGNTLLGLGDIQDPSHSGPDAGQHPANVHRHHSQNGRSRPLHDFPNSR